MPQLPWYVYVLLAIIAVLGCWLLLPARKPNPRDRDTFRRSSPATAATGERARQLLPGLIHAVDFGATVDSLTTGVKRARVASALNDWWNIGSTEQAQSTLGWLLQEGHRAVWPHVWRIATSEPVENWTASVYAIRQKVDRDQIQEYLNHLAETLPGLQEQGVVQSSDDLARGIVAWDMSRAIMVARMCYDCKLITEPQAWEVIAYASAAVSHSLSSWEDVAKSTVIGRAMWTGQGAPLTELTAIAAQCRNDPASPWTTTPFKATPTEV